MLANVWMWINSSIDHQIAVAILAFLVVFWRGVWVRAYSKYYRG